MTNRLAAETSPYLRQHMHNPVDWYPWGDEALARARSEDRPLLVSIGYSACHWCHVMERESFEDPAIAQVMNANFVCVKVDREERPDVDAACMEACQALTGQGGWPLNAFLTPDRKPFFAGTYYPPEPRHGMPDWRTVLEAVAAAWRERRSEIEDQGARLTQALQATIRLRAPGGEGISPAVLDEAVTTIVGSFDAENGGFSRAPKFPMASVIEFLLAREQPEMALASLRAMARGGIYDQVGGGFARYSVDRTWTVPHFEKMLYDNALLARAYLHGFQLTGEALLRRVCTETLDWAMREMRSPEGGFHCALDADSEGIEGKFYVWTEPELREVLGELYDEAVAYFQPRPFEHGTLILEARGDEPTHRDEIRARLLEARSRRVRPGLDDKVLCSWNALMVSALADAGAALDRPEYVRTAVTCAELLLRDGVGNLRRTGSIPAFLDDHAYLLEALLTLYEATFEPRFYSEAVALADVMLERFADPEAGGFFTTVESDFPRRKDLEDSPIPAGGSAAAYGLVRLGRLSGEGRYERAAEGALAPIAPLAARHGLAFGHALRGIDFLLAPDAREVAVVGPGADELARVVRERFHPHVVLAGGPRASTASDSEPLVGVPLLEGRGPVDGRAAAYVCQRFTCRAPVTTPEELAASL